MVIDQYIYLNNLINICFINYFLYIKFKEKDLFQSPSMYPLPPILQTDLMY